MLTYVPNLDLQMAASKAEGELTVVFVLGLYSALERSRMGRHWAYVEQIWG